jgi:hypothetical protein
MKTFTQLIQEVINETKQNNSEFTPEEEVFVLKTARVIIDKIYQAVDNGETPYDDGYCIWLRSLMERSNSPELGDTIIGLLKESGFPDHLDLKTLVQFYVKKVYVFCISTIRVCFDELRFVSFEKGKPTLNITFVEKSEIENMVLVHLQKSILRAIVEFSSSTSTDMSHFLDWRNNRVKFKTLIGRLPELDGMF